MRWLGFWPFCFGATAAQSLGLQLALGLTTNAPVDLRVEQAGFPERGGAGRAGRGDSSAVQHYRWFQLCAFQSGLCPRGGTVRVVPRLGLGVLVLHPETVVRDQAWGIDGDPRGYHLGGWGGQIALALETSRRPSLYAEGKGKWALGYGRVQIARGYAEGWFRSLHGTLGLGWP